MREIKRLVETMGIDYILFPDTSGVLDTPLTGDGGYFPQGGVTVEAMKQTGSSK
jgi:nitrogenase molybdenum-iron protein beta chain